MNVAPSVFALLLCPMLASAQAPLVRAFELAKPGFYSAKATYVSSSEGGVRRAAADESRRMAREAFDEFVTSTNSFFDDPLTRQLFKESGGRPTAPYLFRWTTTASVFSPEVASFMVELVEYTGGAHANTSLKAAVYGWKGDEVVKLSWSDVADASHNDAVKAEVLKRVMAKKRKWMPDAAEPIVTDAMLDQFLVSPAGVAWLFSQGEIGAEAEGTFVAKVPWSQLGHRLRPDSPLRAFLDTRTVHSNWELVEFQGMDDSVRAVPAGRYTLSIALDGGVTGRADVNRFNGAAKIDDSRFEIGTLAITRAMPPPGSYHDTYLQHLRDVRSLVLKGDELFLALKADGGILRFRRLPVGS